MFLTPMPLDGEGVVGNAYLWERRLLDALFFGYFWISQVQNPVKSKATVDAYVVCPAIIVSSRLGALATMVYISAWVSALLVRTGLGNARA